MLMNVPYFILSILPIIKNVANISLNLSVNSITCLPNLNLCRCFEMMSNLLLITINPCHSL